MTIFVPNTAISNTWDYWRRRMNQTADALSNRVVSVNSNATIGYAEIIGGLRANTVYLDFLAGANNISNGAITIVSNTTVANTLTTVGNIYGQSNVYANTVVANAVNVQTLNVGVAIITPTSMTINSYFGNWSGNAIPVIRGGTGQSTVPPNGYILIGANNSYAQGRITSDSYIGVTLGSGTIALQNLGCTTFASNTSNIRSGNVVLTSADVTNALGYVPGGTSNVVQTFTRVGSDLQYVTGNVAIGGVIDGSPTANGTLVVTQADGSVFPALYVSNANTAANTQHALINMGVANTGARMGVQFTRGANSANVVGSITYTSADLMVFKTSGLDRAVIDTSGNIGIGTTAPSPNKGGNGIHILNPNPGLTLDTGSQVWTVGVNPNPSGSYYGGVRKIGAFGIYSDTNNTGLYVDATSNTQANGVVLVLNNATRVNVSKDGNTYFTGAVRSDSDMFASGYQTTSDYREKNSIEDIPLTSALNRVRDLRPVSFYYNNDYTHRRRDGFIAHELQETVPAAVLGSKDGITRQTVDKSEVVPLLTKAIQALLNRVEDLELKLQQERGA